MTNHPVSTEPYVRCIAVLSSLQFLKFLPTESCNGNGLPPMLQVISHENAGAQSQKNTGTNMAA